MRTVNDSMSEYGMNRAEFIRQQQENMRWMRRCITVMIVTVIALSVVACISLLGVFSLQ